jgi:FkbM family methyltransferase
MLREIEFGDVVCRHMYDHGRECVFIQVGAYDGISTDPLRRFIVTCGWKGTMLEPQPEPASLLRKLYDGVEGIVILEAAVDGEHGKRSLYTVESDDLPEWAGGMASFDRQHLVTQERLIPGITSKIRELTVDCITFDDVLETLPCRRLDILQIDAEGADGYLISLFPFNELKPAIIQWEIKNMSKSQQEATLDLLCELGYRICRSAGEDMLAVLPNWSAHDSVANRT